MLSYIFAVVNVSIMVIVRCSIAICPSGQLLIFSVACLLRVFVFFLFAGLHFEFLHNLIWRFCAVLRVVSDIS